MNLTREQQYLFFGVVLFFVTGIVAVYWQSVGNSRQVTPISGVRRYQSVPESGNLASGSVLVHVDGAVYRKGVYRFPVGTRICDAVKRAVPDKSADLAELNLAAPLQDGMTLRVPSREYSRGESSTGKSKVVNLNRANTEEIDQIPGIGPTLAARILDYRKAKGPFLTLEDLQKVPGIGKKLLGRIKDYVRI